MKLTKAMKRYAVQKLGVAKDASDDVFVEAISKALTKGTLSTAMFAKLAAPPQQKSAPGIGEQILESLKSLHTALGKKSASAGDDEEEEEDDDDDDEGVEGVKGGTGGKTKGSTKLERKLAAGGAAGGDAPAVSQLVKGLQMEGIALAAEEDVMVRVKGVDELYDKSTSALVYGDTRRGTKHAMAGLPVVDHVSGRQLHTPSEWDKAVAGVWAKFSIQAGMVNSKNIAFRQLKEHEQTILLHALHEMKWGGSTTGDDYADIKGRKLSPMEMKALIDDATSGGIEAAPIVFDDMIIQTPLLYGELYPLVNVVPLDRGRRVEGVSSATVTGTWDGVDDTAITPFSTTSYISAFDTTIHRWDGAFEIGLDFMSDTPIDFGSHVTSQYGERLLKDLDDVIATGDGSTRAEGITVKTGATSVAFGGAVSLGNYESLRFGVPKQEHNAMTVRTAVFVGNELNYQRARAIPVGANDARRLGGMDYGSYRWMDREYKVNESMANTQVAYAILARYRMYRRRGLTFRTSREGRTLMLRNSMLIVGTARYGGQMERGACIARTSTAPA